MTDYLYSSSSILRSSRHARSEGKPCEDCDAALQTHISTVPHDNKATLITNDADDRARKNERR